MLRGKKSRPSSNPRVLRCAETACFCSILSSHLLTRFPSRPTFTVRDFLSAFARLTDSDAERRGGAASQRARTDRSNDLRLGREKTHTHTKYTGKTSDRPVAAILPEVLPPIRRRSRSTIISTVFIETLL